MTSSGHHEANDSNRAAVDTADEQPDVVDQPDAVNPNGPDDEVAAVPLDGREDETPVGGRSRRHTRADRVFPTGNVRVLLEALVVAAFACVFATLIYHLWDGPLHLPVAYLNRDLNQTQMTIKTIVQTGWILHNPHLGAPYGQVNYDFPQGGESLQYVIIRILALFTSSTGLIINLYYFGGFGLLAGVTYLVLRHLRFGPVVSAVVALPYAFLPLHLYQNEAHITRTTYLSVPLGVLLLTWVTSWRERFLVDPAVLSWRANLRWRRIVAALVICLVVGSWETMATAFTLLLLALTAVLGAIRWHDPRRLVVGLVGLAGVGIGFLIVSFPSLWYWHTHGKNLVAGKRIVAEAELYGLKLNAMILPSGGGRFHFMNVIAAKSQAGSPVPSEGGQSINLIFTLGFLGAVYAAVAGVRRARANGAFDWRPGTNRESLRELLGMNTILAVLFGTIAGFSTILALIGFGQVRTWDRIVLFIAFFALLQVAIWLERFSSWARTRFRDSPFTRPALGIAAVLILLGALYDGPRVSHPKFGDIVAQWANDTATVAAIERTMPAGTNVMQVPTFVYPEAAPPGNMLDYDPLRPFLADEKGALNWSYGSIKGRPDGDWQEKLTDSDSVVADLPALLGMGFTGLWVDTFGYVKDPTGPTKIAQAVGVPPIVSPDGRFQFYDLRPYQAKLGKPDAQLRQLAISTFGITPPK